MRLTRNRLSAIIAFLCLELVAAGLLVGEKLSEEGLYYSRAEQTLGMEIHAAIAARRRFATLVFDSLIATPETKLLMHAAARADGAERGRLRADLQRRMAPLDERLQQEYFRQFHFHLPDGVSFLRLHQPNAFGDSLFPVRPSVLKANTEKRPIEGFEIGRLSLAYRFVFPLLDGDQHEGSVEVSVPFLGLRDSMSEFFAREYFCIYKKEAVERKLFQKGFENFQSSSIAEGFLMEKADLDHRLGHNHAGKIPATSLAALEAVLAPRIREQLGADKPFAVGVNWEHTFYLATFSPLFDLEDDCIGYLYSLAPDHTFSTLITSHFITFGLATGCILLFLTVAFRWTGRMEERLRFQRNLLNSIPVPVFYKGLDGAYLGCNTAFEQEMETTAEKLSGLRAEDLTSTTIAEEAERQDREILLSGEVRQLEVCHDFPNGDRRDMLIYKSLLRDEDDMPLGIINTAIDITERNENARRVESLSRRLQLILESAGEGVFGLDREGRITFMNRAGEEMLGWKSEEVLGLVQHELVHHSHADGSYYPLEECPTNRSMSEVVRTVADDEVFWRRDGSSFPVTFTSTPICEADGQVHGTVVVFRDITAWKEAAGELARYREHLEELVRARTAELQEKQAQLLHASRLSSVGEMATAMAHEIFQPLNVIAITVQTWELLAARGKLTESVMNAEVDKIRRSVERISRIIEHVRTLGRFAPGEVTVLDLRTVAGETLSLCRMQFRNRDIEIQEQWNDGVFSVMAVASEIEQVLLNLLANARDAVEARRERETGFRPLVRLRGMSDEGHVLMAVEDNGGGVPVGDAERIFTSFYTTKPAGAGTGLGLSISRQIVEKFGGVLECRNRPGEGACFVVTLPLHPGEDARTEQQG